MSYTINLTTRARKQFQKLPQDVQKKILQALEKLANNPFSSAINVKKLQGIEGYRLRVGEYRVIYELENDILTIEVISIAHRQHIY